MDFIKNPQITIVLTFLTHIISGIDGVIYRITKKIYMQLYEWGLISNAKLRPTNQIFTKVFYKCHVKNYGLHFLKISSLYIILWKMQKDDCAKYT